MFTIHNATILTPEQRLERAGVRIKGNRIDAVGPLVTPSKLADGDTLDATGLFLVPGFIDLQFNGGFGHDFTDNPASIWEVAAQLPRYGVTAFLPTVITSPPAKVKAAQQVILDGPPASFRGAEALGLHVEGPFLNPKKKGAHNPDYLRLPDRDMAANWSPQNGVRLVTLAPELPGARELVSSLAAQGVLVSAGHSAASYEEAVTGFDCGIRYGTHLFNAMALLHHRDPGLSGALLEDPRPGVGLIADGIHTHQAIVRLVWHLLGPHRLSLVTDAMAALGMAPGQHLLGDFEVTVDETSARLADGTLAGSILSLDQAVRNLVAWTGCSLEEALAPVTTTPARLLNQQGERGQVAPGYLASLVLLTPDLEVHTTLIQGQIVFTISDAA